MDTLLSKRRLFLGIGLTTAATLMLQLTLTRIFSVVMYYHFAFLAISLALFGLGAAGVYVYLRPKLSDPAKLAARLTRYGLLSGVFSAVTVYFLLQQNVGLDVGTANSKTLTFIYLVAALPFLFSGMVVTLIINHLRAEMTRVYFYDLVGAGLGCLVLIPLLDLMGGPSTVLLSGFIFMAAGALFWDSQPSATRWKTPGGIATLAVCAVGLGVTVLNTASPFLHIPSVKGTNEGAVLFSGWNSFSRVTVEKADEDFHWLKYDSSAATRIFSKAVADNNWEPPRRDSEVRVASMVYSLRKPGPLLIIGPGGGADVISALYFGHKEIYGVELNPITVNDVMKGQFKEWTGDLYNRPEVHVEVGEGRSFVRSSDKRYSSIQATLVDTWAATAAGAFTLAENLLYTQEAFTDFIGHLTDDGILTMTRWSGVQFQRLLVLGRAALDELGITDHAAHFYVAADHRMATFLLKKTPFTAEEVASLDAYVRSSHLTRIYSPLGPPQKNPQTELIRAANWHQSVEDAVEDISPPTDNRPFFFYTVKPKDIFSALGKAGQMGESNLGLLLLFIVVGVVGVLVLVFLFLPLFVLRRDVLRGDRGGKTRYLIYFLMLGAGFITIEMALMQEFVLFLGHPTFSLVVILFSLLISSGIGSFLCRNIPPERLNQAVGRNILLLAGALALSLLLVPLITGAGVGLPLALRMIITVLIIAPLGLIMGTLLPMGVQGAGDRFGAIVPWAWGLNGATSVFGSVLALAIAMNVGFKVTLVIGIGCYLIGWVAVRKLLGPNADAVVAPAAAPAGTPPSAPQSASDVPVG